MGEALGPLSAFKLARDLRRGRRGVLAIVHLHAITDPLRPAIVSGDVRYNYREFESRINRLTHSLTKIGVGPGERLALFLNNGAEFLELSAAAAALGAVTVQVGTRLKAAEVAHVLQDSGARALIFSGELHATVSEALAAMPPSSPIHAGSNGSCIAVGGAPLARHYDDLVGDRKAIEPVILPGGGYGQTMLYTSGTTGRSKGARRDFSKIGFEPIFDFLTQIPIRRDDRHLVAGPLYHVMAPSFVAFVMAVGGCNVILSQFDPEEVLRTIERERITSSVMVPTMLARLVELPLSVIRRYDTSSLRWLMSSAAPLPTEVARKVEDTFGPILYNCYGATETGVVTLAKPGEHTRHPGTIGRTVRGVEIRLLDEHDNEVKVGEVGELYVSTPVLMEGYHGDEAATRAGTRNGAFSVGDLAYRDVDGFYYIVDRKTDMVISGGVNIYPWEIEQRLFEHEKVVDVAVLGVPDPKWGESLVAFVVTRGGEPVAEESLRAHVGKSLADFKRPKHVFFVEELPRTPTGKILKRELRQRALHLLEGGA